MDAQFKIGDRVRKRAGYEYPGFVVSVFANRAGAIYVVEADHVAFKGKLHIFSEEQLELRALNMTGHEAGIAQGP